MASPVPPGVPRPGHAPPNFNPNYHRGPDTVADNMQNLQINRPTGPPSMPTGSSIPGLPPFSSPPYMSPAPPSAPTSAPPAIPSSSLRGSSPVSRPGPQPAGFQRMPPPVSGSPQATQSQNLAPGRPSGPPFGQPSAGVRPAPGAFASALMASGPFAARPTAQGPLSNGPPMPMHGAPPGAPTFPGNNAQYPPVGPPPPGVAARGPPGSTSRPFPGSPPSGPPLAHPSQTPPLFLAPAQTMPPPPFGSSMGQMQPLQGPLPGTLQPPRMYGMPQPLPSQSMPGLPPTNHLPMAAAAAAGSSKIDPNQIPRPFPTSFTNTFETRQGGQANIPPPATSDYIAKDTGNCSPRYMRCTINQIPCTGDLLSTSSMQLALMVQPLALPHPEEEPIQVVDFGETGPVRCSRCKGYINPFMKFIDQGKRFICNLCGRCY